MIAVLTAVLIAVSCGLALLMLLLVLFGDRSL